MKLLVLGVPIYCNQEKRQDRGEKLRLRFNCGEFTCSNVRFSRYFAAFEKLTSNSLQTSRAGLRSLVIRLTFNRRERINSHGSRTRSCVKRLAQCQVTTYNGRLVYLILLEHHDHSTYLIRRVSLAVARECHFIAWTGLELQGKGEDFKALTRVVLHELNIYLQLRLQLFRIGMASVQSQACLKLGATSPLNCPCVIAHTKLPLQFLLHGALLRDHYVARVAALA